MIGVRIALKHDLGRIVHAQLVGHAHRGRVAGVDHGDEARDAQGGGGGLAHGAGGLGGIAVPPGRADEAVADFDLGAAVDVVEVEQTAVADERVCGRKHDGVRAIPPLLIVRQGAVDPLPDVLARLHAVAVAHHFGIAEKYTQGVGIVMLQGADAEAGGGDYHEGIVA